MRYGKHRVALDTHPHPVYGAGPLVGADSGIWAAVSVERGASLRDKYLFVRVLEACNAGCFMCGYANSRDSYRLSCEEFARILDEASDVGVRFVRFTGGEPLIHPELVPLLRVGTDRGFLMSLITNGKLLPRMVRALAAAGTSQVIVSLDAASASAHDELRASRGCFDNAVLGLRLASELGIRTRVNTVVGPHNYSDMPALQELLYELKVDDWELSTLKLPNWKPKYVDSADVRRVGEIVYSFSPRPKGKRWYGDTESEQEHYFRTGLPPRASGPLCHVTDDVLYLDAKNGKIFVCACISHHPRAVDFGASYRDDTGHVQLQSEALEAQRAFFAENGPAKCTGCSSTAAGYSDLVSEGKQPAVWSI